MLGLAVSAVAAAVSAALRWSAARRLERHAAARDVDLFNLEAAAADLPAYVVVSGTVRVAAPVTAPHAPSTPAVLVHQEQTIVSSVWDAITARWYDREMLVAESTQTASFVLQKTELAAATAGASPVPGLAGVAILADDIEGSGLVPTVTVHDGFVPTGSAVRDLIGYAKGEIPKGTRTLEQVVPANQRLTAYGELVRIPEGGDSSSGGWRLRRPSPASGGVFFLSPDSRYQIERNDRISVRLWTALLAVSVGAAAFFLIRWLFPILSTRYALWRYNRRRRAKPASGETATDGAAARFEQADSDRADAAGADCVVCLEGKRDIVLVPCGHIACCQSCAAHLQRCPLCRQRITQAVRIFHG